VTYPFDVSDDPRTWLRDSLLAPLAERAASRASIAHWATDRPVETPDEAAGDTAGAIVLTVPEYIVQQTDDGRLVRHNVRLLKTAPSNGAQVRVAYKDGYGDVAAL
jgi:hypothetical protein